jgi:hypothetical protein
VSARVEAKHRLAGSRVVRCDVRKVRLERGGWMEK